MGVGGGGASKAFCNAHMKQHISKGGFPYFAVNVQVLTSSGGIEDFINRRARRSKTGTVTWDCFVLVRMVMMMLMMLMVMMMMMMMMIASL